MFFGLLADIICRMHILKIIVARENNRISFLKGFWINYLMNAQKKLRYKEKLSHLDAFFTNLYQWMNDYTQEKETGTKEKTRFAMYHMGQLCVEVMTDIAAMILKDLNHVPKDDYSNFKKLLEIKTISANLEKHLTEAYGLRNRLAHDYNGIDEEIALEGLEHVKETVTQFRKVVDDWLQKH